MPTKSLNINDIFFEGIYKDVWKKMIPPGLSEAECDFIEEIANLQPQDHILDLMCGYGRHAIALARRGYPITAVDSLEEYIKEINATAQQENLPIEAFAAGALNASFLHQYKAIICMGNSFAFFNRCDAVALLKKVAAHLATDGVFIINSWMVAEIAIKYFREKEWHDVDGYKYLLDYRFHFYPSRIESEHTIVAPNGAIEVIQGVDYIFTLSELETMLNEAGLRTKESYSTPKKKKFKMGDTKIYIVTEKAV